MICSNPRDRIRSPIVHFFSDLYYYGAILQGVAVDEYAHVFKGDQADADGRRDLWARLSECELYRYVLGWETGPIL